MARDIRAIVTLNMRRKACQALPAQKQAGNGHVQASTVHSVVGKAALAQLVEHIIRNDGVSSSSLLSGTILHSSNLTGDGCWQAHSRSSSSLHFPGTRFGKESNCPLFS